MSNGQILYEAYAAHADWVSVKGEKLPHWHDQSPAIQSHWEHAAEVLLRQQDGQP